MLLHGKYIFWDHFEEAFAFNSKTDFRLYCCLSKDHVHLHDAGKMRNHLAINILNYDMLNLMEIYQSQLPHPEELASTILLLEQMAVLVDIFCNDHAKIDNIYDIHIQKILSVVEFFQEWEQEFSSSKDITKHLLTCQTREDIDLCIYGFVEMVKCASSLNISLIPGYSSILI